MEPVVNRSFSPIKSEYIQARLDKALENGVITDQDTDLIRAFIDERRAVNHITVGGALRLVVELIAWRRYLDQPFHDVNTARIYSAISAAKEDYKAGTLRGMVATLKTFFTWMIRNGHSKVPIEKINDLKMPKVNYLTVKAADLLTKDDIEAMVKACRNSRDRALISVLYESACRIKEIATMTWSQVEFDQYGAILNILMKTGKPRYIRLLWSSQYLSSWRADYPGEAKGDAMVFLTMREKKPLTQSGTFAQISEIAQRAGIEKRVSPHLFRHSRITELLRQGASEQTIKKLGWGDTNTRMISIYGHLVNADIDRELLGLAGLTPREDQAKAGIVPGECPYCLTICSPWMGYCPKCGHELTEEVRVRQGTILEALRDMAKKDPEGLVEALRKL